MKEDVLYMFNSISVSDYFISNPYSSSCNKAFKKIFQPEDFLEQFYFISNKTYERLAAIAYVANDSTQNTIFITGFRGCGKTCFMNLLNNIIEEKFMLPEYSECLKEEIKLTNKLFREQPMEGKEEVKLIKQRYNNSKRNILHELKGQLQYLNPKQSSSSNFVKFISETLKGNSVFLNFDSGNYSNNQIPFNQKFIFKIELIIELIINEYCSEKYKENPFCLFLDFYSRNCNLFNEAFEQDNILLDFIDFLKENLINSNGFEKIKRSLDNILYKMNLEQMLCILTFLYISKNMADQTRGKLFFILDNMDIIYRNNILEQSMYEYQNFITGMNNIMDKIDSSEKEWSKRYENIVFVFAMRETTAMQIADQFFDSVDYVAKYFDISLDTDKAYVVEKKFDFIRKYKKEIANKTFIKNAEYVHRICTDIYIKNNIFPMFNNDFKRAMFCITEICKRNIIQIKEKMDLLKRKNAYDKNGARGILFRLIYNEFMRNRYFEKIGIEWPTSHKSAFTASRIILTILYNLLPEYNQNTDDINSDYDRMNPETISIHRLYEFVTPLISKEEFINSLLGMYNLKNVRTWNHLITFDNIKSVTYTELEKVLDSQNDQEENKLDVDIRITCAGTNYVKFICTHFEFFSCRFTSNTQPLFCKKNSVFSEKYKNYNFEYIIDRVYQAVVKCCDNLEPINDKIIALQKERNGLSFIESEYIFKNKTDKIGRLHEERIIHRHITYIDNYRRHLVNDIYSDNVASINQIIISYIEKYINLLENPKYGEMSKILFEELNVCLKYIKEEKDYLDKDLEISRDGYIKLIEEGYKV